MIAEFQPDADADVELVRASTPVLPPLRLPVEAVDLAAARFESGEASAEEFIEAVDRHGDELERAIARRALQDYEAFRWAVEHAAVAADRLSLRLAQWRWIRRFPNAGEDDVRPAELTIGAARGAELDIHVLIGALERLALDEQLVAVGRPAYAAWAEALHSSPEEKAAVLARVPA